MNLPAKTCRVNAVVMIPTGCDSLIFLLVECRLPLDRSPDPKQLAQVQPIDLVSGARGEQPLLILTFRVFSPLGLAPNMHDLMGWIPLKSVSHGKAAPRLPEPENA